MLAAIHLEIVKLHAGEVVVAEHFPAAVAQGQRRTGGLAAIAQADSPVGKLPKERIGAGQSFATQSRPEVHAVEGPVARCGDARGRAKSGCHVGLPRRLKADRAGHGDTGPVNDCGHTDPSFVEKVFCPAQSSRGASGPVAPWNEMRLRAIVAREKDDGVIHEALLLEKFEQPTIGGIHLRDGAEVVLLVFREVRVKRAKFTAGFNLLVGGKAPEVDKKRPVSAAFDEGDGIIHISIGRPTVG